MRSFLPTICISVLLVASSARAQNLLTNGSFESPDVAGGTAEVFESIPGWTDATLCGIEVQDNCCGSPSVGSQHVELDSTCSSAISQTVTTTPGAKYLLTFDFSPRPSLIDNRLVVRWNGVQVFDEIASSIPGPPPAPDTSWTAHAIVVTATGATATVEFKDGSFSDGVGTYIDNLPEPGRSAQLAAGLSLLAALDFLRRRAPRSRPRGRSR